MPISLFKCGGPNLDICSSDCIVSDISFQTCMVLNQSQSFLCLIKYVVLVNVVLIPVSFATLLEKTFLCIVKVFRGKVFQGITLVSSCLISLTCPFD